MKAPTKSGWIRFSAGIALATATCTVLTAADDDLENWSLIATQVPVQEDRGGIPHPLALDARYPTGSRIVLIPPGGGTHDARVLSPDFVAAGAPSLSYQADFVVFAGREKADSTWAIFEAQLGNSSKPRKLIQTQGDCSDPAYLAGDRLVFACSGDDADATWSLYTAARDGSDLQRITFGPGPAFHPTPLPDGRILFSMWQGPGPGRRLDGSSSLFTVNPDGTLLEAFAGNHQPPAHKSRARLIGDGGVVFVTTHRDGTGPGIERVEMSRPLGTQTNLPLSLPAGADTALALESRSVQPFSGRQLLVAARPTPTTGTQKRSWGIYRVGAHGGTAEPVLDDPGWDEIEAVPVMSSTVPRGRPSALQPDSSVGTLVCYDTARSDGSVGPEPNGPRPTTVTVEALRASPSDPALENDSGEWNNRIQPRQLSRSRLGAVAVESDGSFFIEVPADLPVRVVSLDTAGRQIATSAWFWVRPGEVRACFGCHESRDTAPVNRAVKAISRPPVRMEATLEDVSP